MMTIGISSLVNLMINRAIKDIQWKCLRPRGDPCELSSGTTERKERLAMMIYSRVDQQFSSLTNRLEGYSFTKSTAPFLRQKSRFNCASMVKLPRFQIFPDNEL